MQIRRTPGSALALSFLLLIHLCALPAQAAPPAVEIVRAGSEEVVAPAEDTSCPGESDRWIHVPDTPISAFRRSDGSVVMLATNRRNFPLVGPSVDQVARSTCSPLLRSSHDSDPARYRDNEWLISVLKYPNGTYAAFIHDEYHGYEHDVPGCKVERGEVQARRCWYASTTYALSHDGGFTFQESPTAQAVAALGVPFSPDTARVGFGNPKAVIDPRDGTPYLMVTSYGATEDQEKGQCLLRGDPADPGRWRAWDGHAFSVVMGGAYGADHSSGACKTILPFNVWSVRFYKPLNTFVAFGQHGRDLIYLTSSDLRSWSDPSIIGTFTTARQWRPGDPAPTHYYSLLDPTSASPSFDTIEGRPYLYFVRWRIENGRPVNRMRDLLRQPLVVRART